MRAYRTLTHRTIVASAILALALLAPASAMASKRLVIAGSTSMLPLIEKLAVAYHKEYRKIPAPKVEGGQTDIGIDDVAAGKVDIGDASRDPIPGVDPTGLVFTKVARDGICMITNEANPLPNLNQETVQGIFTGNIRSWSEVPGASISGPIDLFDREAVSGTQDAFQHIFLGEALQISPSATQESLRGPGGQRGQSPEERDRVRLLLGHDLRGRAQRRLRGRAVHTAQRQVRPIRRRS